MLGLRRLAGVQRCIPASLRLAGPVAASLLLLPRRAAIATPPRAAQEPQDGDLPSGEAANKKASVARREAAGGAAGKKPRGKPRAGGAGGAARDSHDSALNDASELDDALPPTTNPQSSELGKYIRSRQLQNHDYAMVADLQAMCDARRGGDIRTPLEADAVEFVRLMAWRGRWSRRDFWSAWRIYKAWWTASSEENPVPSAMPARLQQALGRSRTRTPATEKLLLQLLATYLDQEVVKAQVELPEDECRMEHVVPGLEDVLRRDPWGLMLEGHIFSFKHMESVAGAYGAPLDTASRGAAALFDAVRTKTRNDHTYVIFRDACSAATKLLVDGRQGGSWPLTASPERCMASHLDRRLVLELPPPANGQAPWRALKPSQAQVAGLKWSQLRCFPTPLHEAEVAYARFMHEALERRASAASAASRRINAALAQGRLLQLQQQQRGEEGQEGQGGAGDGGASTSASASSADGSGEGSSASTTSGAADTATNAAAAATSSVLARMRDALSALKTFVVSPMPADYADSDDDEEVQVVAAKQQAARELEARVRTLDPKQQQALMLAVMEDVVFITGAAGCGKTFTITSVLDAYTSMGLNAKLCAPTGRAAARMREVTGYDASTIHRLLKARLVDGTDNEFELASEELRECDAVVVDEASMVDVRLMASLLKALPEDCKLILVGDVAQLTPVAPGTPFSCSFEWGALPHVHLDVVHRQAKGSTIISSAHDIKEGCLPQLPTMPLREFTALLDEATIDTGSSTGSSGGKARARARARGEAAEVQHAKRLAGLLGSDAVVVDVGAGDPLPVLAEVASMLRQSDVNCTPQVISPAASPRNSKGEPVHLAVPTLNKALQDVLNPQPDAAGAYKHIGFHRGDRVVQIVNDSSRDVWNGDVGKVLSVAPAPGQARGGKVQHYEVDVMFGNRRVTYDVRYAPSMPSAAHEALREELDHAWAISVHKAQGGEFPVTIIALDDSIPNPLLNRKLLYTAVTRARGLCIVLATHATISKAVSNRGVKGLMPWEQDRAHALKSSLRERLERGGPAAGGSGAEAV